MYVKAIERNSDMIDYYTQKQFFMKETAEYYNNLGATYEKMLRQTSDRDYFDKALNCYDNAIKNNREYSQSYYNKGVLYWSREEWRSVIENFKKALQYEPKNQTIKNYLAVAERKLHSNEWCVIINILC